jgi:hypothetical protein
MANPVQRLDPAATIIARLGGVQNVSVALGLNPITVMRWSYPRCKGGSAGLVPSNRQRDLLDLGKAIGAEITPADFFVAPAVAA